MNRLLLLPFAVPFACLAILSSIALVGVVVIGGAIRAAGMLLHTQGLDGLLHLYNSLETGSRVLLLCLLCAEAGWLILVNAWLRLERAYLKTRLFLRV